MSDYRKRSTKRKKRKEATLVGDLFKILFAVSMLIIAILVAFFVFKNVSGFHLPDLRVTAAETQESETATVVSIDTKESAAVETSAQIQMTESAQLPAETAATGAEDEEIEKKIESVEASIEESVKSSEAESKKESTAEDESRETKESKEEKESKESKSSDKVEELPSRKDTEIEGPVPGSDSQGEVSNGPVVGPDTVKESPETVQKDGAVISEGGPLGG
ncbi:MAG: hypothetical protein Q4Q21_08650 [Lachnospiraceae bacterium]|nr:hypothetical protein [Lachnospiraceae bacterium]